MEGDLRELAPFEKRDQWLDRVGCYIPSCETVTFCECAWRFIEYTTTYVICI